MKTIHFENLEKLTAADLDEIYNEIKENKEVHVADECFNFYFTYKYNKLHCYHNVVDDDEYDDYDFWTIIWEETHCAKVSLIKCRVWEYIHAIFNRNDKYALLEFTTLYYGSETGRTGTRELYEDYEMMPKYWYDGTLHLVTELNRMTEEDDDWDEVPF